jgi:hypothetical protein
VSRLQAWCFHLSNAAVAVTGLVYAWCAYCATSDDPFAITGHPQQAPMQHAHVAFAPLLVFCVGVLWSSHARLRVISGARERRSSGLALVASFAPAAMSGYLIQIATDEAWRSAWVAVHLATSGIWLAATLVHIVRRVRRPDAAAHSGALSTVTRG